MNMGQSTNDMFPTAIHVAVAVAIQQQLIPALERLPRRWPKKAQEWDKIIKIGRTHLADATPLRLGQEIGGLGPANRTVGRAGRAGRQAVSNCPRAERPSAPASIRIPNSAAAWLPSWPRKPASAWSKRPIISRPTPSATGWSNATASLRAIATTLFNVSNNIRWLGSGPRCGFYEIMLPDRQPGSSIMPGKVNPVMCESMMQVAAPRDGQRSDDGDQRGGGGPVPVEHHDAGDGQRHARKHSAAGQRPRRRSSISARWRWKPTRRACEASVEKSLSMVTSLNPLHRL